MCIRDSFDPSRACEPSVAARLYVPGCTAVCEAWRDLRTRGPRYPRRMRKLLPATLVLGIVLAARPTPARADFGIGLFLGEPTGLDILLGFTSFRGRAGSAPPAYQVSPLVGNGSSVTVPLRLGVGAAVYD